MSAAAAHIRAVLEFWFAPGMEKRWFASDPALDGEIAVHFCHDVLQALEGRLDHWAEDADGALALILLLDQFPRNLFRRTPQAFAGDEPARAVARKAVERGWDGQVAPARRTFFYLPFEHSEVLEDQLLCVSLFEKAGDADGLLWAGKHLEIIRRFGRFPHRNAALGRESTAEELEFLKMPGSSF